MTPPRTVARLCPGPGNVLEEITDVLRHRNRFTVTARH
ncbi:MAG: hypothetical protein CM1200mP2_29860 [Planctomycetaceae bacterium]|nr:MAG: hypothetical protein CM1200mP2_29860 [Planctomycetaceae bacterium]